ncbi:MAG: NTP/NDP exchange transporter [Alphaproteobacteria bacterium]|nr:NTP/NDP exchange transporter [Alphaproteobacteria bacterium]
MKTTNTDIAQPEFSKLRTALFPIHNNELKKFLPMGAMMFFILFIYTILRDTKDSLVITSQGGDSAVLPFLKLGLVLPASILFVMIYAKMSNAMKRENVFYAVVSAFVLYFGAFAFFLYPNKDLIHPSFETVSALQEAYPNFQHVFPVWGNWTYSMFYVLSELWGSVMISLLFWQFANEITRTKEAKRFYGLFGLLANLSLICSGFTVNYLSRISDSLPEGVDAWGVSLNYMMSAVVVAGFAVMVIYRWMNTAVLTDPKYYDQAAVSTKSKKDKPKLSIGESFKYLIQSKYLGYIAILIIGYGLAINLVEIVWKGMVKQQYPTPNEYNAFMGIFSATTGFVTMTLIMLFKGVVSRFGWYVGAVITPAVLLVSAVLFFAFVLFGNSMDPFAAMFGTSTLFMAVVLGAAQNIFSKGTKYSLFDPTKEMAYIPLDQELKVKGKAAVDVIGGRLGKAGGGLVSGMILTITAASSAVSIAPYLGLIVIAVIALWIFAAGQLNKLYTVQLATFEKAEATAANESAKSKQAA